MVFPTHRQKQTHVRSWKKLPVWLFSQLVLAVRIQSSICVSILSVRGYILKVGCHLWYPEHLTVPVSLHPPHISIHSTGYKSLPYLIYLFASGQPAYSASEPAWEPTPSQRRGGRYCTSLRLVHQYMKWKHSLPLPLNSCGSASPKIAQEASLAKGPQKPGTGLGGFPIPLEHFPLGNWPKPESKDLWQEMWNVLSGLVCGKGSSSSENEENKENCFSKTCSDKLLLIFWTVFIYQFSILKIHKAEKKIR